MVGINVVPVLVATVVAMVIGFLWYSPLLFGKPWMRLRGLTPAQMKDMRMPVSLLFIELFTTVITAYVLAILVIVFGAHTLQAIVSLALVVWLGFYVTTYLSEVLWENKPFGVFLINAAHRLVGVMAMVAILGLWR